MAIYKKSFPFPENDTTGAQFNSNTESADEYGHDLRGNRITQPYSKSAINSPGTNRKRRDDNEMFTLPDSQESFNGLNEDSDLLHHYLQIFWKRKVLVISMTILILLLAAAVLFNMKSVYRATGTLLVESEPIDLGNIKGVISQPNILIFLKTQSTILTSRELAERVIKNLNLVDHPEFQEPKLEPAEENQALFSFRRWYQEFNGRFQLPDWLPLDEWLPGLRQAPVDTEAAKTTMNDRVDIFLERLNIELLKDSQIFKISFEANDPQLATDIVNNLMQSYIDLEREKRQQNQQAIHQRIGDQLSEARQKLKQAEQALQSFREQEDLLHIEGMRTLTDSELATFNSQFLESSRTLDKAERLYNQANSFSLQSIQAGSALPLALRSDELLDDLIAQQSAQLERLNETRFLYTDDHPEIATQQDKLKGLNSVINSRIKTLTAQLKQDYDIAKDDHNSASQLLQASKAKMLSINHKQFQLNTLQSEVNSHREFIDKLNNRLKESNAASDVRVDRAGIIDSATQPSEPFKPQRKKLLAAAVIASIMFGLFIALLREYFDRTVKTSEDIEERINIPLLGYLPQLRRKIFRSKNDASFHYFQSNPRSIFAEAVRSLSTNVLFSCVDSARKIIVVTSSCPGEGKSLVSVNLARSLAESSKVLLIDADMRKPSIARIFGIEEKANGLSHYAANLCSKTECLYHLEDIKLSIMPAGIMPPNPLALLSSDRFKTLLNSLIKDYDYIIIDSPPLIAVSDALILSTYASGTILVVKENKTLHKLVLNSVKQLARVQAPLIGAVLNASKQFNNKAYNYGYNHPNPPL